MTSIGTTVHGLDFTRMNEVSMESKFKLFESKE